jgi:integrase
MARTAGIPRYRKHASGQARVTLVDVISGRRRDVLLGRYGTRESKAEYGRAIAAWEASGRRLADEAASPDLTVNELLLAFWRHAEQHYRRADGTDSGSLSNFLDAARPVRKLFGLERAAGFGPLKLQAVRQSMIANGLARTTINDRIARVKLMFKWAASQELIPADVAQALTTVAGLECGRTTAREPEPIRPVAVSHVEKCLPFMPPPVAALVRLQLLTAARPGELVTMRTCDLDTTGRIWVYRPPQHKNAHRGNSREIYVGPQAQAVLKPWLKLDLAAYLFSPREAEAARQAERNRQRQTPRYPSHMKRNARKRRGAKRRRPPAERYTRLSYAQAITRACDLAFPAPEPLAKRPDETIAAWKARLAPEQHAQLAAWRKSQRWHPHQLRHTAATQLRKEHGVELARIILGHSTAFTTEIYAEADREQAIGVIAKIG